MLNEKGSAVVVGIVAAVVGLAIGLGGAKMTDTKTKGNVNNEASSAKASDLRVALNAMEREHVHLAAAATRKGFDGAADFKASAEALDSNSVALAKAVGSVYGADAEKQFLEIWRSHIN